MADGSIIIDTKVDPTGAEKDINKLSGILKDLTSKKHSIWKTQCFFAVC